MVKHIKISEEDKRNISLDYKRENRELNDDNFQGIVVNKPWGYEYLLFQNKGVAIWMLYIKKGHSTSMHCHPKKKTSLIILSGMAKSSTLNSDFELKEMEGLILDEGVFHKTEATSDDGIFMIETETPVDKYDLFRLKDNYKRETESYTKKKNITDKLYNYDYLFLKDLGNSTNSFGKYKFIIKSFKNNGDYQNLIGKIESNFGIIISGNLKMGDKLFTEADLISSETLKRCKTEEDVSILFIKERKDLVRLSDFVISFLQEKKIENIFLVSDGKIMYLLDAIRTNEMNYVCSHHEQAATMAAEGYAKLTGEMGVALVTGGSGSTNAITSVASSWVDSTPLLVISGQSYDDQTVRKTGLRQRGVYETDIVKLVRPITKYSVMVKNPRKIKYHLEKAIYLAKTGRPGPVWIDIPINLQMSFIDKGELNSFEVYKKEVEKDKELKEKVKETIKLLRNSKRPIILLGNGVRIGKAEKKFSELLDKLSIPVVMSKKAIDVLPENNKLYVGRVGALGQRAANFAVQNSDLFLSVGSGVDLSITGWAYKDFARNAKKIMINIDKLELKKPTYISDISIKSDVSEFVREMELQLENEVLGDFPDWKLRIENWKNKYPDVLDKWRTQKDINAYNFVDVLSNILPENEVIIVDIGMSLQCVLQAFKIKTGQRIITSSGLGSAGFSLPGAIGSCIGNKKKRVVCLIGDGALQRNLQELQTILHNNLPVKIFVLDNKGYYMMKNLQKRYFEGNIGVDSESGISMPDILKLARAYGIKDYGIEDSRNLTEQIKKVLDSPEACVCNIKISKNQEVTPRQGSFNRPDGMVVPRPIEDMFPYLEREELEEEMIIEPVYFDPYKK